MALKPTQQFREDRQRCYRILSDYYYLLKKWEADNSPQTPEEEPHPRFVEAIHKKIYVEYLLDLFLYESVIVYGLLSVRRG